MAAQPTGRVIPVTDEPIVSSRPDVAPIPQTVSRWMLTDDERARIAAGAHVQISVSDGTHADIIVVVSYPDEDGEP
ncbi:hypothetical protein [Methylobacterium platani]|uniref:Uncharacterized protein n=3 Tax=Methylobacterium platani TaxID=427683 RepID=A0A179SEP0_9HYPH|nr:hypothetical protein [Methylobacterium platani]KMO20374.1 hypothetical protein SQ03_05615 [Methylobacterium platani JCM 14648]OAS26298.1 hypothetical protein A5481_06175 [Methylobacterium platani]